MALVALDMKTVFYNAHHSPTGAFASLTLGMKGPKGGLGLELAGPANESIYVGVEDRAGNTFSALPFFEDNASGEEDFDVEGNSEFSCPVALSTFDENTIGRTLGASLDEWTAPDLKFRIYSPPQTIPDPARGDESTLKAVLVPALRVELEIDNRGGSIPRRAFFGYRGTERSCGMRILRKGNLIGVGQHTLTAIASDDPDVIAGVAFQPEKVLNHTSTENLNFLVGSLGMLVGTVQPGEVRTFRFAVGFFREGTATTGIDTRYYYRRYFTTIEDVVSYALADFDRVKQIATDFDQHLHQSLSPERAWMTAQAIRSYYGSTQLLERSDGTPLWVVNEGEYRMMNTFDLTVDQAFFELASNPWTIRNVLDLYAERYSYEDTIRLPNDKTEYDGGLAFTHDMGVSNAFSRPGYSGYEQAKLTGCFSYMCSEELMNWIICAGLYLHTTKDTAWAVTHRQTLLASLASLTKRDHPDSDKRNGVIGLDGSRCQGGSEITTYDSLDTSLGQARNSLYLAVKGWASYMLLAETLAELDEHKAASIATEQAERAIETILASASDEGLLPAVIGEGCDARIIPAIEAVVYPYLCNLPIDGRLLEALQRHLSLVLARGVCKFQDGGWKLSSTSKNSWLSKIYLCQFVAEEILGFKPDKEADIAHTQWLQREDNAYFAWSDQMLAGKAVGSRYYPRGVTSILWLARNKVSLETLCKALWENSSAVKA